MRTIYQNVQAMISSGWQCDLFVVCNKREIAKCFGEIKLHTSANLHHAAEKSDASYNVGIATMWSTCHHLNQWPNIGRKLYFVQDYEPSFFAHGDSHIAAENTYALNFEHITIGRWLSKSLAEKFGGRVGYFDFCADLSCYKNTDTPREDAVCFIFQPDKTRRCPKLGLQALEIVRRLRPQTEIYTFGSDRNTLTSWFSTTDLGLLTVEECALLYNRCAVGLCLSASNPSRVSFEMMACGLPVVELHRENNLYDLPESATLLAHQDASSVAKAIISLLESEERRREMSRAGTRFMQERPLAHGFEQFLSEVEEHFHDARSSHRLIAKTYEREPIKAETAYDVDADTSEVDATGFPLTAYNGRKRKLMSGLKSAINFLGRRM